MLIPNPTNSSFFKTFFRLVLGAVILIATRAIAKPIVFYSSCLLAGEEPKRIRKQAHDIRNTAKIRIELATKFLSYLAVGFNTMFVVPIVFQVII